MKLMKVMLLAAVLVTSATAAHAANKTFGVGGGMSMPIGNFADFAKMGYNGGVYGDYWIKTNYAFGADITGNFFGGNSDLVDGLKSTVYPDASVSSALINFGVHGMWVATKEGGAVTPWITYGVGYYNVSAKIENAGVGRNLDNSDGKFGFNGGGGLNFKGNDSMTPGVDVKYHYVMTDNDATSYWTAGVHLTIKTSGK